MPDKYSLHTRFIEEINEYVLTNLRGSADSQNEIYNHDPPHRFLILGSLAPLEDTGEGDSKTSIKNNSFSIKFKMSEEADIPINLSFFTYSRCKEKDAEDGTPCWVRQLHTREYTISKENLINFNFSSDGTDDLDYVLELKHEINQIGKHKHVTVSVANVSKNRDAYIYDVKLKLRVPGDNVHPYHYSYIYEDEEFPVNPAPYFRTVNCYAVYENDEIIVTSISKHVLYKRSPKLNDGNISLTFADLEGEACIPALKKYSIQLRSYMDFYSPLFDEYDVTEKKQIRHLNEIISRFENGIRLLESEPEVLKAFQLMNEAFRLSTSYPTWRIFQITYIVSSLLSIFDPGYDRDICDVIHVSTGGGKTEAYLGLVIFTAIYDKIKGFDDGVSAIVKFPLRMLSIQQLKRVAKVTVIADDLKSREGIGGSPISLSYFVGDSFDFPNKTSDALEEINRYRDEYNKWPRGNIISECPFCNSEVELQIVDSSIRHVCTNSKCNRTFYLYYTDEEVYRYLPSIIVSTVDKFATVSKTRHVKNIFGADTDYCKEHGHISKGEKCLACGKPGIPSKKKSTVPSLIIQDELHLIRESFGTIDAHFESFCDELQRSLRGSIPKRIALTATITGCYHQVDQLYNREPFVFPGKFPDSEKDPFFLNERGNDGQKLIHRVILGMKPNSRDNQYAILITLRHLSKFLWAFNQNIEENARRYGCTVSDCDDLIEYHNKILTYHGKVSDVHTMNHFMDEVVNTDETDMYIAEGHPLLGEKSLGEIDNLIKSVQTYKRDDKAGLHCTFSTSIVSHGVDIKEWNIMMFQGMPDNTAEYIQALSRVGRTYPGLVYVWFYPTRIRDLSFYGHFDEYHNMIEHKVEPVSINKWTALSLEETFTSIFNASILNYISAVTGKPLYRRNDVIKAFSDPKNKENLLSFLNKVYRTDEDREGAYYFFKTIPKLLDDRLQCIFDDADQGEHYFPFIFDSLANGDKYYAVQSGMRGIQDNVIFGPSDYTLEFLNRGD